MCKNVQEKTQVFCGSPEVKGHGGTGPAWCDKKPGYSAKYFILKDELNDAEQREGQGYRGIVDNAEMFLCFLHALIFGRMRM